MILTLYERKVWIDFSLFATTLYRLSGSLKKRIRILCISCKQGVTKRCRLSCWPIAYMSPNAGGGGELRGFSQWVKLYTRTKINFADPTPYLTYGCKPRIAGGCSCVGWLALMWPSARRWVWQFSQTRARSSAILPPIIKPSLLHKVRGTVAQGTGHSCARYAVTGGVPVFLQMILYGGLGINKIAIFDKKISILFSCFFSSSIFGHQYLVSGCTWNAGCGSGSRGQCITDLSDPNPEVGDLTTKNQTITVAQGLGLLVIPIFLQMILITSR